MSLVQTRPMPSHDASPIRNPAACDSWVCFTFQKASPIFSIFLRFGPEKVINTSTCASETLPDNGCEPVARPAWLQARSTPCKPFLGIDWPFHMSPWFLWRALDLRLRSFVCSSLWVYHHPE